MVRHHTSRLAGPWPYFVFVFVWTWLFWGAAALSRRDMGELPVPILVALGGLGPALGGIGLTWLNGGCEAWADYWRRVVDLRRVGGGWLAITLLWVPALTLVSAMLATWIEGRGAPFAANLAPRFEGNLLSLLPFLGLTLFFGPLPEELGWRGYVLDPLQARYGVRMGALVLGVLWTVWHAPLFFVVGSYQNGLAVGSAGFWWYMVDKAMQSMVMAWIMGHTERSTLTAILFHLMVNFCGEALVLMPLAEGIQIGVWAIATGVMMWLM